MGGNWIPRCVAKRNLWLILHESHSCPRERGERGARPGQEAEHGRWPLHVTYTIKGECPLIWQHPIIHEPWPAGHWGGDGMVSQDVCVSNSPCFLSPREPRGLCRVSGKPALGSAGPGRVRWEWLRCSLQVGNLPLGQRKARTPPHSLGTPYKVARLLFKALNSVRCKAWRENNSPKYFRS